MPAYNGAKWIKAAIDSVLAQSFKDFELIVINDSSKDNTEEILRTYRDSRIKYFKNEKNLGVQKTRNIALSIASGKFIAEIDQDDEWIDEDKLIKQLIFLIENKNYVLIGTGAVMVDEKGNELARYLMPAKDEQIRSKIMRANPFIHSSVMFRAVDVKRIGGYDVDKMSEDQDLWLRLGKLGMFMNFQDYSVKYLYRTAGYNSQEKSKRIIQNIMLAYEHRNNYPGCFVAILFGLVKLAIYPLFNLMPLRLKGALLNLHKKI